MPGGQGWRRPVCRRLDCSRSSNNILRQRRSVEEDEQQWQQFTGKGSMLQTSSHVSSLPSFLCGGQLLKRNYANAGAG